MNISNNAATKRVRDTSENTKKSNSSESEKTVDRVKQEIWAKAERNGETLSNYEEKVSDNVAGAAEKIDQKSNTAQVFLGDKADIVDEYAYKTIEKANEIGQRAVDVLAVSSNYVKNFDFAETRRQFTTTIKHKPELSVAVAGIFGLLIGLLIGRNKQAKN